MVMVYAICLDLTPFNNTFMLSVEFYGKFLTPSSYILIHVQTIILIKLNCSLVEFYLVHRTLNVSI